MPVSYHGMIHYYACFECLAIKFRARSGFSQGEKNPLFPIIEIIAKIMDFISLKLILYVNFNTRKMFIILQYPINIKIALIFWLNMALLKINAQFN